MILIFGDLHFTSTRNYAGRLLRGQDGEPYSFQSGLDDMRWIYKMAGELKPELIVNLGDTFDKPEPTNHERGPIVRFHSELAKIAPVHVLVGNHDITSTSRYSAVDSLGYLDGVTVHATPKVVMGDLGFLPFPRPGSLLQQGDRLGDFYTRVQQALELMVTDLRTQGAVALFGHLAVAGCVYNKERYHPRYDVALNSKVLDDFEFALFGHIHLRQGFPGRTSENPGGFIGSVNRTSFSEEGYTVGLETWSPDAGRRHYFNPNSVEFLTIDINEFPHGWDLEGKIVRIRGTAESIAHYEEVQRLVELNQAGALAIDNQTSLAKRTSTKESTPDFNPQDASVGDLFKTYVEIYPEAVPDADRDDVLKFIEDISTGESHVHRS